jgi:hypothetical protein
LDVPVFLAKLDINAREGPRNLVPERREHIRDDVVAKHGLRKALALAAGWCTVTATRVYGVTVASLPRGEALIYKEYRYVYKQGNQV